MADPYVTFDPAMHYALVGVLPTKFGGHRALLSKLTPADPGMTFDPSNALRSGGGTTLNQLPIGLHVKILNFNGRFEAYQWATFGAFLVSIDSESMKI